MRYACREVEGTPEPTLHIPMWPLDQSEYEYEYNQCGHRKVVCLFKQETPEGEMATVETRS